MKKLIIEKFLTKKSAQTTVVSRWFRPKGYDLAMTDIHVNCFGITANLVYGKYEEFKRFMKNNHDFDTQYKACTAMCVMAKDEGVTWHYVLIQENEWTADHYNTICHELHHLTHFALDDKGISYGSGGEEVYAYLQGFFMEMVVRAFMELKRVTKKK